MSCDPHALTQAHSDDAYHCLKEVIRSVVRFPTNVAPFLIGSADWTRPRKREDLIGLSEAYLISRSVPFHWERVKRDAAVAMVNAFAKSDLLQSSGPSPMVAGIPQARP